MDFKAAKLGVALLTAFGIAVGGSVLPSPSAWAPLGADMAEAKNGRGGGDRADRGSRGGRDRADRGSRGGRDKADRGSRKERTAKRGGRDKSERKSWFARKADRSKTLSSGKEFLGRVFGRNDRKAERAAAKAARRQRVDTAAVAPDVLPQAKPKREKTKSPNIASKLGALNAAHASPQAFANASPNSRVGRIAAYAAAVEAGRTLEEAQAAFEGLTPVSDEDLAAAQDSLQALQNELAALPEDAPERAEVEALIADAEASLADLEAQQTAYTDAEAALAEAETAATEVGDPVELLEAAANKPVDDDVVAAVNALLGLEEATATDPAVDEAEEADASGALADEPIVIVY